MPNNTDDTYRTLFGILSKFSYSIKSKIIAVTIMLPVLIILSTCLYGYSTIKSEWKELDQLVSSIKQNESDLIIYSLLENCNKSKIQTDYVKEEIVKDLYSTYDNDIQAMKKDFDSKSVDTKFYKIISRHISDKFINKRNDNNRMFVATKNGVLIDDSPNYSTNSFKEWAKIIEDTPNKEMAEDAIKGIKRNKFSSLILWVDNTSNELNRNEYTSTIPYNPNASTIKFIEDCILQNKLDEVLQYNVMVVSYIFDTKDIFEVPDVSVGKRNDNDKIYIVQTFNIKDMIESSAYLKNTIDHYQHILTDHSESLNRSIHFKVYMIVFLAVLEAIAFFGVWYLAEFFIYFHTNPSRKCGCQDILCNRK